MRALLLTQICLLSAMNAATAEEIACLPKIASSTISLSNVPSPWVGSIPEGTLELTGINFSDGPPSEMAFLKEEYSREDQKTLVSKQRFYPYPLQRGSYWLICEYGDRAVLLSKEIPKDINECTVTYDKPKSGLNRYRFRSLTCK